MAAVPGSVQVSWAGLCHRDGPGWVPAPRGVSCMDVLEPTSHSLRGTGDRGWVSRSAACPGETPGTGHGATVSHSWGTILQCHFFPIKHYWFLLCVFWDFCCRSLPPLPLFCGFLVWMANKSCFSVDSDDANSQQGFVSSVFSDSVSQHWGVEKNSKWQSISGWGFLPVSERQSVELCVSVVSVTSIK